MRDLLIRGATQSFLAINRLVPWHRLPTWLSVANLAALRQELRARNLHGVPETVGCPFHRKLEGSYPSCIYARTSDGSYNDLNSPTMGSTGTRFGRNVPLDQVRNETAPELMSPSPRLISNKLLGRTQFQPATSLNLLAAAWIQFQTHDWFSHGEPSQGQPLEIPLDPSDPWPGGKMLVGRTPPDLHPTPDAPITYRNEVTHWWDASQLYGSDAATQKKLRTYQGGELRLTSNGLLPINEETKLELTGFNGAWWGGLTFLHTLFVREHNAVCAMLRQQYPEWNDQRLFDTARQIVAALLAKIHTVEWTPGILGSPALHIAMNANWWGLATEQIKRIWGRVSEVDEISGIIGGKTDHDGEPFALTEEFVAVYRLHPLMPDLVELRSVENGGLIAREPMESLLFENARKLLDDRAFTIADLGYSLGVASPGKICLHNYPAFLRSLRTLEGETIDLAAVDVLRDRERGVPRYNRFREIVGKSRVKSFDEITDNKRWARELREVYGDVDKVDALVGMLAETPPANFGFSDTAFRVFILMASRRLKSDRFLTKDYGPHVYTPEGLRWIDENNMRTVLLRHFPELRVALRNLSNAFAPWNPMPLEAVQAAVRTAERKGANGGTASAFVPLDEATASDGE